MTPQVSRTELSPLTFLGKTAYRHPDRVAVVHQERRYTYRQLAERVARLSSALRRSGLQAGDRVAVLAPNIPAILESHFAVPAAGGVLVTINTRLVGSEIGYILNHSGAHWLLVDAELQPLLDDVDTAALSVIRIDDTGQPDDPYEQLLASGSPDPAEHALTEDDLLSINYTSGTTGQPKGVQYTHRGAYLAALGVASEMELDSRSVYLWTLPMFHCNGWCFPWAVTAAAGRHICLRKIDPDVIWQLIDAEGVTHYTGAPIVSNTLANHPRAHPVTPSIVVGLGGAPPSPTLLGRLLELNLRPVHLYGLTETYGPCTVGVDLRDLPDLPPAQRAELLSRQGQGLLTADLVRIVDDKNNDVPRDGHTLGEVVMHGNIVMSGYFADPEATATAFRGGGFHSGDLAVWHSDGSIELRDRSKDIIISGGENISTIEVEHVLAQHPDVVDVAVVAVPDATWGERPKAFVERRPGSNLSEAALLAFGRKHLAHFKVPVAVEFTPLPKTSTGKTQKFQLRAKEWAGHGGKLVN